MSCIRMIEGETTPLLYQLLIPASVSTEVDYTPFNLTNCSVNLSLLKDGNTSLTTSASCDITDAENGWIKYEWVNDETSIPGMYFIQFSITDGDGKVTILPKGFIQWLYIMEGIN